MSIQETLSEERCLQVPVVLEAGAQIPLYATREAAGADLYARIEKPLEILPGKRCLVSTGISIVLPLGFELQIRSRSGLAWKHGIMVLNSPGTIDSDYRGVVQVILMNTGDVPFVVEPGMRIAQAVIAPVYRADFVHSESLPESDRGSGGFGHSGTH